MSPGEPETLPHGNAAARRAPHGLTLATACPPLPEGGPRTSTAMIYQHEARGADKAITDAIDKHVDDERGQDDEGDDGPAGVLVPA